MVEGRQCGRPWVPASKQKDKMLLVDGKADPDTSELAASKGRGAKDGGIERPPST